MTIPHTRFRKIPVPLALLSTNFELIDVSEKWLGHFNLSEDIIGKNLFSSMPDLPEELVLDIRNCSSTGNYSSQRAPVVLKNGDVIWYEWKVDVLESDNSNINEVLLVLEDITEKKLDEALSLKSEQVARIGGWEVDLIHNTIYWSKITKEIHEVEDDYTPTLEQGISFYKEGDSRDTITRLVQNGMDKGEPWDVELQIVTFKGKDLWVRAIGEPEIINGQCVRITGTFQDIDRRKKAEIEYKKVSDRLMLATDKSRIGIWELDVTNDELLWDSNMFNLYGIQESDFTGGYKAWETCVLPEDLERTTKEVQDAIEGKKTLDTSFRITWSNGEIRWIKAEATVIRDVKGNALKMIGINQDISELKTTQLQLEKSEESLQGAFENSSVGMALVALDGKFISVNQSLCRSLGYAENELLELTFQDITHPDDLQIDLSLLHQVIEGKRRTYQIEKRYFDKNGQIVYVLLTVTAVKNWQGEISHFISQIVDISARIEAEKKLKSILQVTTDQNKSLLNFAHIVSHNLRSHAANLSMISSFLLEGELSEVEQKDTMGMLGRASEGLNETIGHLNEVVQVKLGIEKELSAIPLKKVVNKIITDISALIHENKVVVDIMIPTSFKVQGVPAYIESIILNLITNAIKYRDPDKRASITIEASLEEQYVKLSIKDNGMGIDLDKYGEKLFGMYKTFHGNKDAKGIGLFITKNQIESIGGRIAVESQVGIGTNFTVKLLKA